MLKIDSTTANVERGQYTRLCVEVDLTKPLLSRFRLNGRLWGIQYEGLKMICFKCGWQGHKEVSCPIEKAKEQTIAIPTMTRPPQEEATYGSWMLVKKPSRGRSNRQ